MQQHQQRETPLTDSLRLGVDIRYPERLVTSAQQTQKHLAGREIEAGKLLGAFAQALLAGEVFKQASVRGSMPTTAPGKRELYDTVVHKSTNPP